MKRVKGAQFPSPSTRIRGRASFGHRDMKALTRIKTILKGRGKKSRQPLTRRERRILSAHPVMTRGVVAVLFGGAS